MIYELALLASIVGIGLTLRASARLDREQHEQLTDREAL